MGLLGAEPNAYFYIGWTVGNVLYVTSMNISLALFAEGSTDEAKLGRDVKRSLILLVAIIVPAVLVLLVFPDKILVLFGQDYADSAARLIQVLAIAALPLIFNHVYFTFKRVRMGMGEVIVLNAVITAVTFGLAYWLLPRLGIVGAGVAYLAGQAVVALLSVKNLAGILADKSRGLIST